MGLIHEVFVSVLEVLPGWSVRKGTVSVEYMNVNVAFLAEPDNLSILHGDYPAQSAIEGAYSLYASFLDEPFTLSQVGRIPSDAKYLEYSYSGFPLTVTIDGNRIEATRPAIRVAGLETLQYDVSAFSRQPVTLELSTGGQAVSGPTLSGVGKYDTIAFAIPEPRAAWLVILGLVALFGRSLSSSWTNRAHARGRG